MLASSQIGQLPAFQKIRPQNRPDQQKMLQQTIRQQEILIVILKQEIQNLQNQAIQKQKIIIRKEKEFKQALSLINIQQEKIETLKQNNQSIIHTFEVFQREFVKRDYKNVTNQPHLLVKNTNCDGPFYLQLIKNMKSNFSNVSEIQPFKKLQKSQFNQYYGYFLNQQLDQKQINLFNELSQKRLSITSIHHKIKAFGKKNYFNQKYRCLFWYHAIEKGLRITRHLYQDLFLKLENYKQSQKQTKVSLIDRDLYRMDLKLEDENEKNIKISIRKCLQIFQVYRPDVGYIQGMSYLAWMFLVRMQDYKAFSCFSNLILCDSFICNLYFFKQEGIKKIKQFYQKCMEDRRNKLYKHMKNLQVQSEFFIIEWAYTMFTRAFNLRITSKIWDLWLSEGFNVFFRVVLVIMDLLQAQVLQASQNQKVIQILRTQTHKLDQTQFLKGLKRQRLSQQLEF